MIQPYTWEELKQLVGKPVWIKKSYWEEGKWKVISLFDRFKFKNHMCEHFCTTDDDSFEKEQQGIWWEAYPQEVIGLPAIKLKPLKVIIRE